MCFITFLTPALFQSSLVPGSHLLPGPRGSCVWAEPAVPWPVSSLHLSFRCSAGGEHPGPLPASVPRQRRAGQLIGAAVPWCPRGIWARWRLRQGELCLPRQGAGVLQHGVQQRADWHRATVYEWDWRLVLSRIKWNDLFLCLMVFFVCVCVSPLRWVAQNQCLLQFR